MKKDLHLYTRIGENYNGPPLDRPAKNQAESGGLPFSKDASKRITFRKPLVRWPVIREVLWVAAIFAAGMGVYFLFRGM